MSVQWVHELFMERVGSETISKTTGPGGLVFRRVEKAYDRVFQVQTTSVDDDQATVLADDDIPELGSEHPNNERMLLNSRKCDPEGDGLHWRVVCSYKTPDPTDWPNAPSGGAAAQPEDPDEWRTKISFNIESYSRAVEKAYTLNQAGTGTTDTQGNPKQAIVNGAKERYDPPVTQEEEMLVIRIERNERDFNTNRMLTFINTLNQKVITVAGVKIPKWSGRLRQFNGTKQWDSEGDVYWAVSYEIVVKYDSHLRQVLNCGYNYLPTDATKTIPCTENDGSRAVSPKKLTAAGAQYTDETAAPNFISYLTYYPLDWNALNLPTTEEEDETHD